MNSTLTTMPGHLLRRCQQIAVAIFLEECQQLELTPLHFAVLQTLSRYGAMDQVSLGGTTAMDRSSTAQVVSKLEQRGLLERKRSAQDQRAKIVTVTRRGSRLLATALPRVERAQQRILAPLSELEADQLMRLLAKLAEGNNSASRAPETTLRQAG